VFEFDVKLCSTCLSSKKSCVRDVEVFKVEIKVRGAMLTVSRSRRWKLDYAMGKISCISADLKYSSNWVSAPCDTPRLDL
jgi:hypothetical protein